MGWFGAFGALMEKRVPYGSSVREKPPTNAGVAARTESRALTTPAWTLTRNSTTPPLREGLEQPLASARPPLNFLKLAQLKRDHEQNPDPRELQQP
jgi:hypothetical protein